MSIIKANPIQYITSESGEKISVILPIEEYNKMIEDLHDLAVIAERKNENTFSLSDMKKLLQ
ncbi:MAG: hypothetical protein GX268_03320 [Methanomicrobiales archaeon]|jgi:hypothetical protein|nr:hypothetical protein [Methanomicrobiales archaeon]